METDLKTILIRNQIIYLRESVEDFLLNNKVSQEERKGIEKFRDYQIEEIEKLLEQ